MSIDKNPQTFSLGEQAFRRKDFHGGTEWIPVIMNETYLELAAETPKNFRKLKNGHDFVSFIEHSKKSKPLLKLVEADTKEEMYREPGEIIGSFDPKMLDDYIKKNGVEKLLLHINYLNIQIYNAIRRTLKSSDNDIQSA